MQCKELSCRYFTTYSGVALPLKLVGELEASEINNRNTYFQAYFDADGVLHCLQRVVYGEMELEHCYSYSEGKLQRTEITDADGELMVVENN
ncbi:DUF6156 family protein [Mariprofundus ferrooxydans]|uniref:DUF6156 family protein n=1 Tax=Mariprofundus ferrooxydans TaxID=314344 RepID=UPI00142F9F7A|nr:DUF6156 family protein [Mariprofundus ferrooxydans]